MARLKTFLHASLLGLALALGLTNESKAQLKMRQAVDPLMYKQYHNTPDSNKAGIPYAKIFRNQNSIQDTLIADSLGYYSLGDSLKYSLNVTKTGTGHGSVTSLPSGINCNNLCNSQGHSYDVNTLVKLIPTPDSLSLFSSWTNADSVHGDTAFVNMNNTRNVNALFSLITQYSLRLNKLGIGNGLVTSLPSGINCDNTCVVDSADFNTGVKVKLIAQPDLEFQIDSWTNADSARGDTAFVTMNDNHNVQVNFNYKDTTEIIPVKAGWNIVSLPLIVQDSSKLHLFPTSTSPLFAYDGSYTIASFLKTKKGYWLRFNHDEQVQVTGKKISNDTINVLDGWNLIGSLSRNIPVSLITFLNTQKKSNFFKYDGGYEKVDTLKPGYGYWIKVSSPGSLVLNENGIPYPSNLENILDEQPPQAPNEDISSSKGSRKKLEVYSENKNVRFKFDNEKNTIEIYNILGEKIKSINVGNEARWNFTNKENHDIANGVYFYVVKNAEGNFAGKILKLNDRAYLNNTRQLNARSSSAEDNLLLHKTYLDNLTQTSKKDNVSEPKHVNSTVRLIVDEDGTDTVKNYYRYDSTFVARDSIPDKIALFPGSKLLKFVHPRDPYDRYDSSSALAFDRWFVRADSFPTTQADYLLEDYVQDQPIKVFANRSLMPTNYSAAFDSSKKDWEDATSFYYQAPGKDSVLLTKDTLETEVMSDPATGDIYKYDGTISYQTVDANYPQPYTTSPPSFGPIKHITIHIANNISSFANIKETMNFERNHRYFYSNNTSRGNADSTDDHYYPKPYFGKLLKTNRALQPFFIKGLPRLGVYKEK